MKNKLLWGFVGLILGAAGGYFVGGMTCAKHYRAWIEELEEQNEKLTKESEKTGERGVSGAQRGIREAETNKRSRIDGFGRVAYDKMAGKYAPEPQADDKPDPDDIYLITEQEFKDDLNYRDNETVTWYAQDGVLADSADMPIHDEENVIGIEALDELGNTESEYLYVSNDIENKMYEIIVERNISYYRDLMNITLVEEM